MFLPAQQRARFAAAYSVLEEAMAAQAFPGAVFGVFAEGAVVALDGVGRFTYDPGSTAVTASTVYDLASVTKVIATTSMAMLLYQQGKLTLDQPVIEVLPAFAHPAVTIRMLLTHSSGLPGYVRLPDLAACMTLPLTHAPGTHAEYSDPGFIVLGEALAKLSGEPIDTFCSREVFLPLGMSSTVFRPPAAGRSAIPPTEEGVQGRVQDENCFILGGVSGHAGLFSNALDPLLYAQCVLGQPGAPALFTPATLALFTTRAEMPAGSSRALGWDTPSPPSSSGRLFSRHSAGHLGYAGTSLWVDFERKIAVVLLTNRTWPRRESQAIRAVRPAFHDGVMQALTEL